MFTLQWMHTRKRTPQTRVFETWGQAWVLVMMVRAVFPNHPFTLNGEEV